MIDRIAEKLSQIIGSAPSILVHVIWWSVWLLLGVSMDLLVLIVSLEAILVTLFILRAEMVQSNRLEKYIKEAKQDVKKDIALSKKVIKEVRK